MEVLGANWIGVAELFGSALEHFGSTCGVLAR